VGYGIASESLALPATVGEFWIIGYLLLRGIPTLWTTARPPTPTRGSIWLIRTFGLELTEAGHRIAARLK
jgi:hypothetical protein